MRCGLLLMLALLLAGCGSSEPVQTAAPPTSSSAPSEQQAVPGASDEEAAIRDVHARYVRAIQGGDGEAACALLTEAGVKDVESAEAAVGPCAQTVEAFSSFFEDKPNILSDLKVTGDTAIATADDGMRAFTKVEGNWRVDADPPGGEANDSNEPSRERVAEWPTSWCELSPSSTQEEIRAAMGEPTEMFDDQDSWDGFGYGFTAFYDETGTVRQLDYNSLGLSKAQEAKLTCDETRKAGG